MAKDIKRHFSNLKSSGGTAPAAADIVYGEIAVGYKKGAEALYIKNHSGNVVTFSSDNIISGKHNHDDRYYTENELTGSSTSVVVAKAASATTAANVDVISTNPSSSKTYYPTWVSGSGDGAKLNVNNGLKYVTVEGTTTESGGALLYLGNATSAGTAGNKEGELRIYSSTENYGKFKPSELTANRTYTFPNKTGTVALTSDIPYTDAVYQEYTNIPPRDGGLYWYTVATYTYSNYSKNATISLSFYKSSATINVILYQTNGFDTTCNYIVSNPNAGGGGLDGNLRIIDKGDSVYDIQCGIYSPSGGSTYKYASVLVTAPDSSAWSVPSSLSADTTEYTTEIIHTNKFNTRYSSTMALKPNEDSTYNIGTSSASYKNVYANKFIGLANSASTAVTAIGVNITNMNPTAETTYYPTWVSGSGDGAKLNANNGFKYNTLQGTTTATGLAQITLGNSTSAGTNGNKEGNIIIYSSGNKYGILKMGALSGNRTYTFPNKTGTVALTDDIASYSAGAGLRLTGTTFVSNVPRVAKDSKGFGGQHTWIMEEYTAGSNYNLPSNAWYHIMSSQGGDSAYGTQLALGMTTAAAYYREYNNSSWGAWKSILYDSTKLPLTGGTMTGSIIPNTDNAIDLGSSTKRWNHIYSYGIWGKSGAELRLGGNDATLMYLTANNRCGIGTDSPEAKLGVAGGDSMWAGYFSGYGQSGVYLAYGGGQGAYICSKKNDTTYLFALYKNQTSLGSGGDIVMYARCDGKVGICTSSPAYNLDVSGTSHFTSNATFDANIVNTYYVLNSSSTNPYLLLKQGSYSWYIQGYLDYLMLGYGSANSVKIDPSGNLTSPAGITALSDARHKQVISDTPITVEQIAKMPSVLFKWTDGNHNDELHIGTLAQSWQSVLPQAVLKENNEEGTLSFNYGVAALVSSITTARKVVDHEKEIKALKAKINVLEERISELEK